MLRIDYSTNNHSSQLYAASDLDCYLMGKASWTKNYEKTLEQLA